MIIELFCSKTSRGLWSHFVEAHTPMCLDYRLFSLSPTSCLLSLIKELKLKGFKRGVETRRIAAAVMQVTQVVATEVRIVALGPEGLGWRDALEAQALQTQFFPNLLPLFLLCFSLAFNTI